MEMRCQPSFAVYQIQSLDCNIYCYTYHDGYFILHCAESVFAPWPAIITMKINYCRLFENKRKRPSKSDESNDTQYNINPDSLHMHVWYAFILRSKVTNIPYTYIYIFFACVSKVLENVRTQYINTAPLLPASTAALYRGCVATIEFIIHVTLFSYLLIRNVHGKYTMILKMTAGKYVYFPWNCDWSHCSSHITW